MSRSRLVLLVTLLTFLALATGCRLMSTATAGDTAQPTPTSNVLTKPAVAKVADPKPPAPKDVVSSERGRLAAAATWAPGQLQAHFDKHGAEGDARSTMEYDLSARDTIRNGTEFTYQDRESNARRRGFYDRAGNRFTGVTNDGRRITTSFRPDRGEAYVRNLERSTYR